MTEAQARKLSAGDMIKDKKTGSTYLFVRNCEVYAGLVTSDMMADAKKTIVIEAVSEKEGYVYLKPKEATL